MMCMPAKDITLAHKFASYAAADDVAAKIAADDPDWGYGVAKAPGGFVITVHDDSEDDHIFLGYL